MNNFVILPFPPSTNHLFPGKTRRFKSKAYKAWLDEAWFALRQQQVTKFEGRVRLKMLIGPGRANADCSNYIKATEDFLVSAGIIQGDSKKHVKGVSIDWDDGINGVQVEIEADG